jgi:hypothetical protein
MISRLREVLGGALGGAGLATASDVWQLAEAWSTALGARIASKATPLRLSRGELVVAVDEAVWRQELALLAPQIVARLNQALGRDVVQRLRLVAGDVAAPDPDAAARTRRRLPMVSTAAPPDALPRDDAAAAQPALGGALDAALRSLAAKRAERVVADRDAAPSRRDANSQAASRRRW